MKPNQNLSPRRVLVRRLVLASVTLLLGCAQSISAQWSPTASPTPSPGTNIYYNSGNVGIGTSSPSDLLHLRGANPQLRFQNTAGGSVGFSLYNDTPTFIGSVLIDNSIGDIHLSPFGVADAVVIKGTSGNVGIGATSPGVRLHVTNGPSTRSQITISDNNTASLMLAGGNSLPGVVASDTNLRFRAGANYLNADSGGATVMTLDTAGNVGIGTTSPRGRLEVSTSGSVGSVVIGNPNDLSTGTVIIGTSSGGQALSLTDSVNAHTYLEFTSSAPSGSRIRSDSNLTLQSAGGGLMTLLNGGNVGIGTTGPRGKLDVSTSGSVGSVVVGSPNDLSTGTVIIGTSSGGQALSLTDSVNAHTYLEFTSSAPSGSRIRSDSNLTLQSAGGGLMTLLSGGKVGIGTNTPAQKLDVAGNINVTATATEAGNITLAGTINAKYQDVSEWVLSSEQITTGTVVVLDSSKSNQVIASTQSYDTRVAGVVSEKPGIALGESGANKVLVATTGRVLVKVDASNGPIHIGDLLVTSDIPGLAMKSEPIAIGNRKMHMPGTLIGKALEPLEKGSGKILVLLSLQ